MVGEDERQFVAIAADDDNFYVECESCGLTGPSARSTSGAIAQWNMLWMTSAGDLADKAVELSYLRAEVKELLAMPPTEQPSTERLIASLRVRSVDGRYPPVPDIDPPWGAPGIEPTVPGFYWILPWVCATDTDPGYPIGDPHVGLLKVDEYDSDGRALSPPVWHELTDGVVACAGVAAPHPGRCAFRFMPMNAPTVP